jgi:hypothetical protein
MLREIICPQIEEYMLHIPPEYLNKKVEILVLPFLKKKRHKKSTMCKV